MTRPLQWSWLRAVVTVGALLPGPVQAREGSPQTPEGSARVDVWRSQLPGHIVAQTAYCPVALDCEVFLAVRPLAADGADDAAAAPELPRRLYRFRLAESASLTELPSLPPPTDELRGEPQLAVMTFDDGVELFIAWGARGFLRPIELGNRPRSEGGWLEPVVVAGDPSPETKLRVLDSAMPLFVAAAVGRLEVLSLHPGGSESRSFRLPVEVDRRAHGLELSSPPVRLLRSEPPLYAVGPQRHGDRRLHTLVIDPRADPLLEPTDEEAGDSGERWSRLPGPEQVVDSHYLWIAGRPILAATTLRSDRMGIFERKKLRLFELEDDRTRTGSSPFFATLTASRRWQELAMEIADADGDGTPDLVLIQPEGLAGNRFAVDLYRGLADGLDDGLGDLRFESEPARTLIRVAGGSWHLGDDWTGDGRADLLSLHDGTLRLFPGQASSKSWLSEQPLWAHRLEGPVREVVAEDGSVEEATPTRHATFGAGLVIVRSRYPQGNDLIEIVAPSGDVGAR